MSNNKALWLSSSFVFYCWFLWIAGANIIPQAFFLEFDNQHKEAWLAATMMLGSTASVAGIFFHHILRLSKLGLALLLILTSGSFMALFFINNGWLFLLVYCSFRFLSCYLYNQGESTVINDFPQQGSQYSHISVLLQLAAILSSPLYFSQYLNLVNCHVVIIIFLAMLFLIAALHYLSFSSINNSSARKISNWPNKQHQLFLAYCASFMAIVYLFSAKTLFFLSDYYQYQDAIPFSGLLMFVTFFCSFLTSVFVPRLRAGHILRTSFPIPALLLACACLLIFLKLSGDKYYLLVNTSLIGMAYGLFMLRSKSYVVGAATTDSNLVSFYNVLPYITTLPPFVLILVISQFVSGIVYWYVLAVLFMILALMATLTGLKISARN